MKNSIRIKQLLAAGTHGERVVINGWLKTRRDGKGFSFLEINDGSCRTNIQVIVDNSIENYTDVVQLLTGSAMTVSGRLAASPGKGQQWEIQAETVDILNRVPEDYPLQKKRHSDEFLRTIAHLRPRTNKYGALFRIRAELAHAIHTFFRKRGFVYIHTPILTGSDCEGAGALFTVTTLNLDDIPQSNGTVDFSGDFFGQEARLTVSGQLEAEMAALSLGNVYTFGPAFRAENSNTARHAAEFWMVEPEMAFCDLTGNMDMAETLLKEVIREIRTTCSEDLELFTRFVDTSLPERLDSLLNETFARIDYSEALTILQNAGQPFQYPVEAGKDLQSEHERFLTEVYFHKPVIIKNFPRAIKPFYMRVNEDGRTVAAMDVLVPRLGEIIGGSQREERLEILTERLQEQGLSPADYWWYLDSRRFGSVPHSGFGLGFERLLMLLTGVANIRDAIPFPRTPKNITF